MTAEQRGGPGIVGFCSRHYVALTLAVLLLAAFNLTFRIGHEVVTQWDESLYAITAWEIVEHGHWIGTTFLGSLDYYNTKPPLNVWLIALSFEAFGRSLVSLRLVSVVSAWLTVAFLILWARRWAGPTVAIFAGLVLSTAYGFLKVHSGRSANTDALYTLLVLLAMIAVWVAHERPWHRVWLGPLLAAVFLLRGMGVLMPLAIILAVDLQRWRQSSRRWMPAVAAVLLFVVPVVSWGVARWRLDEWRFFERLFFYDFVARSLRPIERHPGSPLFYLNVLQKYQYDWLLAGAAAWILFPVPWHRLRAFALFWRGSPILRLCVCWAGITLLLPTVMSTKVSWYLNPFYPVFALGMAWLLHHAFSQAETAGHGRLRTALLVVALVVALGTAEAKLVWHSYHRRDLQRSVQGMLLAERAQLAGHRVYRSHWDLGEIFVLGGVIGADYRLASGPEDFARESQVGDFLVSALKQDESCLMHIRSVGREHLFRRVR